MTGSEGMLGQAVVRAIVTRGHHIIETNHQECPIETRSRVQRIVDRADVVINCAGVTPKSPRASVQSMILANSLGPHILAEETRKKRLVHVSTDCVFSGENGMTQPYKVTERPDPKDMYGRSKLLGEPMMPHVLVVRTSFVGQASGLLHWLLEHPDGATLDGWERAIWNGTSVQMVADALANEATTGYKQGIHHLSSSERVSKFWLLRELATVFGRNLNIKPVQEPVIDRTLSPTMQLPDIKWSLRRLLP